MDLPVIDTPIFPRWVWIEEITYSHIPIATIITAFMFLAPIYEYIGYRRKDLRYDRLSRGLIWFAMILFSPGAALGTGIPVFIIGTYPEFWSRWSNLFFWPLFAQFLFFLAEVFLLFFGYYLSWDRLMHRKRLHIFFGSMAAMFGLLVQVVWDALGSYMLTPGGVALPAVKQPVAWSAQAFFNPSFPLLLSHRFFGNLSYTMLLVGGVFALRYMAKKDPEEKKYFGWAADLTFTVGLLAFFAQPFIGWLYARVIGAHAPVAFGAIMGGHTAPHLAVKMVLIGTFLTLGGVYLFIRHRRRAVPVAISAGLASLLLIIYWHPPLDWIGGSRAGWYAVSAGAVVALIGLMWLARGRLNPDRKVWQWAMFVAGLAAFFTFTLGGFIRERSKSPDTVYGEIAKPEQTRWEIDRRLTYAKCLGCHEGAASFLDRARVADWGAMVRRERQRPGAPPISDAEVERIVRFLEARYP